MTEFGGHEDDFDKRAEIIARSSILSKFLNDNVDLDPDLWATEVMDETTKVMHHLEVIYGENFLKLNVIPLLQSAEIKEMFPQDTDRESSFGFIEIAIAAGYQLEDPNDAVLIMGEFLVRLGEVSAINTYDDEDTSIKVGEEVWSWVLDGIYLRYDETGVMPQSLIEENDEIKKEIEETPEDKTRLDVFDKFFKRSKKLDDLDKN